MPREQPCVWVTAGVLSYRPCDRDFDCDACPLYTALRAGGGRSARESGAPPAPWTGAGGVDGGAVDACHAVLAAGCVLHLDRAYSADGLWMEAEGAGRLRIGLDAYTWRLLQPVADVELAPVGAWLQRGSACAWVRRGAGRLAVSLRAPVACEVLAVHPPRAAPAGGPKRAAAGRGGAGWWLRVAPHEPVAEAGAYRDAALVEWFLGRVRAVRAHLAAAVAAPAAPAAPGAGLGPVVADGGVPLGDLEAALGRERFAALVAVLFPLHI